MEITVRKASLTDLSNIVDLYLENSNRRWSEFDKQMLESGLRKLISAPSKGFQMVAEVEQDIIGILRIAPEWSPLRDSSFWWIENVYVRPNWRRKGVYRKMYNYIYDSAKKNKKICGIRLYTEQDNTVARKTYVETGMRGKLTELFEIDFIFGPEARA